MKKVLLQILIFASVLPLKAQIMMNFGNRKYNISTIDSIVFQKIGVPSATSVNTIVIHESNGTRDSIALDNTDMVLSSSFYGKENPVDNDYIKLYFTLYEDNSIGCSTMLTDLGVEAPHTAKGVMFSSNHIEGMPQDHNAKQLYFVDTKQWYEPDSYTEMTRRLFFKPESAMRYFSLVPGQCYYARAYYVLDDKVYYSSEIELRVAKTKQAVINHSYADYYKAADNIIIKVDAESIINAHSDVLGTATDYAKQLFLRHVGMVMGAKSSAELQAIASKTEQCDDGLLYVINEIPAALVAEVVQAINEEQQKTYYMQANLSSVYDRKALNNEFSTNYCTPIIIQSDGKWGIRGNQYLSTVPYYTVSKPRLALEMNYTVQPGKTYDITLTVAPNTQNEADTTKIYFTVYIASLTAEGTVPLITEAQAFGTDTIINNKPIFIANAMEQKVITMQYKASNFADKLYLQLDHHSHFLTSANRARFSQDFRVVGVEIRPHEE